MTDAVDRGFTELDEETAPAAARPIIASSRKRFGFVPSALARMVAVPGLAQAFRRTVAAFEETSLTPLEREVIVLAMARQVSCEVCVAIHTPILRAAGGAALVDPILSQRSIPDERLAALVELTREMLDHRGDVPAGPWARFLAAGFSRAQALEVVLGIGAYTLSMYANRLTGAPVDPQLGDAAS